MKAYIQDLCGDEDHVVVDCAILQCMLQDAIFEKLVGNVGKPIDFDTLTEVNISINQIMMSYIEQMPSMSIDFKFPRKGDND